MTLDHLSSSAQMGLLLQKEVEVQLLTDLRAYNIDSSSLRIDWSNPCGEGHCTHVLDGNLEDRSDVNVVDNDGEVVAEGWMDFIHGGDDNPLYIFWLFLRIKRGGRWIEAKAKPGIPLHVWEQLPDSTRSLCAKQDEYDARWGDDPLVLNWRRDHPDL